MSNPNNCAAPQPQSKPVADPRVVVLPNADGTYSPFYPTPAAAQEELTLAPQKAGQALSLLICGENDPSDGHWYSPHYVKALLTGTAAENPDGVGVFVKGLDAAYQPAPQPQAAKPVAWQDPATGDVITSERKSEWENHFGIGGKTKASTYTLPLYADPLAPAQAAPRPISDFPELQKEIAAKIYSGELCAGGTALQPQAAQPVALVEMLEETRDMLARVLIKVRRDAPDLSGKLLGHADAVIARADAILDNIDTAASPTPAATPGQEANN